MELLEPVENLIDEVESATGKPVKFKEVNAEKLYGGGEVNVTRAFGKTPCHTIRYVGDPSQFQWKVSHECLHILRIMSVPMEERLSLKDDPKTIKNGFKILYGITSNPFNRKEVPPPAFKVYNEFRQLIISGSLASGVQDIWVDGEIVRRYERTQIHEEMVEAYREWSEGKLRDDLALDRTVFTDKCYEIVNASNWATLNLLRSDFLESESIGLTLFEKYPSVVAVGDKLIAAVQKRTLDTYRDDMDIIDEWAKILGIRNCYFWWNPETGKKSRVKY